MTNRDQKSLRRLKIFLVSVFFLMLWFASIVIWFFDRLVEIVRDFRLI